MRKSAVGTAREAKGTPARRQHFVPQFYLRGFVGKKDQLFVIDRPTEKSFRTAPKNVAAERDFNRVDVEGMDPNMVEKALAKFEGEVAPALERAKMARSLANKEDREAVMNLMSSMALRNPRQREAINELVGNVLLSQLAAGLETKEKWESQLAQMNDGVEQQA